MTIASENTTQQGASIHERLMSHLAADDSVQEEKPLEDARAIPEDEAVLEHDDSADDVESEEVVTEETDEIESEAADLEDDVESDEAAYELSDIAQLYDIDENALVVTDDGKIAIKTKVDGKEGTTTLKDLIKSYQLEGHLQNQNRETVELKNQLKAQQQEAAQQLTEKLQQIDDWAGIAINQLNAEYNAIDWNELRADDPGEYAAKQAEFQARQGQIQSMYQNAQQERQKITVQQQAALQEVLERENQILVQKIPGWDNPDVAQKEYREVLGYGEKIGYSKEALSSIQNHLDVEILLKAMRYDQLQSKKPEIKAKVKVAPKIAKPGSTKTQGENKVREIEKARQRVRSGAQGSVAEWLLKTGKV